MSTTTAIDHSVTSTASSIRQAPIFSEITDSEMAFLMESAAIRKAQAGEVILSFENPPVAFTFLLEGQWTMHRIVAGNQNPVVWTDKRPGSWHGGVNAIDAIAPPQVVADEPSLVLVVSIETMLTLIRTNSAIAAHMLRGIYGGAELLWTWHSRAAT